MRFVNETDKDRELTYEDVFLLPQYSEISSRMDVDLTPGDSVGTTTPIVVANMTAVAGRRMAETVGRRGGLVILPQDMPIEKVAEVVSHVKSCHSIFETPVVLGETESIQTALNLIYKRAHGAIVVVDKNRKPVGIFTAKDAKDKDHFMELKEVMSREIISLNESATPQKVFQVLEKHRISFLPIIKKSGKLVGVLTMKGALRATIYKPAFNSKGKLLTAAAIGVNGNLKNKIKSLLELGVDIIVLDTAHGHQKRMLQAVAATRSIIGRKRNLVAGNVVTAQATEDLIKVGASIVKVGVGPGAMCITRMATAAGRPQFKAVMECASRARELGAYVWADGGIRHPRDLALAIAAGASSAVIGSLFAGTYESPADIKEDEEGRFYKENFGMASTRAVANRIHREEVFEDARKKYFEEGVSESKIYLREGELSAEDLIDKFTSGLRSALAYTGAGNLEEFYEKAVVGVQTPAGFKEGKSIEKW